MSQCGLYRRRLSNLTLVLLAWGALLVFHSIAAERPSASATQTQAEQCSQRGMNLIQTGDLDGAEQEFRQAVKLSPSNAVYLAQLASVLGMQNEFEESSRYFSDALKLNPGNSTVRRNLAFSQLRSGQLLQARKNLELVLRERPGDLRSMVLMGLVSHAAGDYSGAVRWFEKAPELVKQDAETLVALARAYYRSRQMDRARALLKTVPLDQASANARLLGGQVAAEAGDLETAEELFSSIEPLYPNSAELAYHKAYLRYRAGKIEECVKMLEPIISAGQATADVLNLLGWCFWSQDKPTDSLRTFEQVILAYPQDEKNYLDLGKVHFGLKHWSEALETAQRGLGQIPRSFALYELKGRIEAAMGLPREAIKSNQRALELNPSSTNAMAGLALAQAAAGMIPEAVATFDKGIKAFPHDAMLHLEYGKMLLLPLVMTSIPAAETKAYSLLERSIALDGSLADSHYQLGLLALKKKNLDQALDHLLAASRLDDHSSKIRFSLAEVYRRMGKQAEFTRELGVYERLKAQEDKPGQPEADALSR